MTAQSNAEAWGGRPATPPTLNVERLNELADYIDGTKHIQFDTAFNQAVCKRTPRKPQKWFNMSAWFQVVRRKNRAGVYQECGTTGCIAGWARQLYAGGKGDAFNTAKDLLGLTWDQADDLFYTRGIRRKSLVSPHRAAKVLRRLAKTGKVDWSIR